MQRCSNFGKEVRLQIKVGDVHHVLVEFLLCGGV